MRTGAPSVIRWLALVTLGVVPIAAAALAGVERARMAFSGGISRAGFSNAVIALVGLALLVLPQAVMGGPVGETLWIGGSSASIVLAVFLVAIPRGRSAKAFGLSALLVAATAIAAPALWRLVVSENFMLWWVNHTNIWAALAAMAASATIHLYRPELRTRALVLLSVAAVLAAAATGSRTVLFAIAAGVVAGALATASNRALNWRGVAGVVVGMAAVGTLVLLSPLGSRLVGSAIESEGNLVLASEDLGGQYWTSRGVEVVSERGSNELSWFRIASLDGRALDRVHQRFVIPSSDMRTLTFDYRQTSAGGGVVAFTEGGGSLVVPFAGSSETNSSGNPELVSVGVQAGPDGWTTLSLTVHNTSAEPLIWRVGLSPNLSNEQEAVLDVRQVRMTRGAEATVYVPTYAETRVRELASLSASQRLGYAQGVIGLVAERPFFGHGSSQPFHALLDTYSVRTDAAATNLPWHAHSLVGDLLVRFGLVGLLGFLILMVVAVRSLPPSNRSMAVPFLVVVFVLGLGDATFFNAGGPFVLSYLVLSAPVSTNRRTQDA